MKRSVMKEKFDRLYLAGCVLYLAVMGLMACAVMTIMPAAVVEAVRNSPIATAMAWTTIFWWIAVIAGMAVFLHRANKLAWEALDAVPEYVPRAAVGEGNP